MNKNIEIKLTENVIFVEKFLWEIVEKNMKFRLDKNKFQKRRCWSRIKNRKQ